jgi:lysine-specific demethylase 8
LVGGGQIDVERPDLERFPLFAQAQGEELVLEAGEMLYLPPHYWHFVRSLSVSFSISFWFD